MLGKVCRFKIGQVTWSVWYISRAWTLYFSLCRHGPWGLGRGFLNGRVGGPVRVYRWVRQRRWMPLMRNRFNWVCMFMAAFSLEHRLHFLRGWVCGYPVHPAITLKAKPLRGFFWGMDWGVRLGIGARGSWGLGIGYCVGDFWGPTPDEVSHILSCTMASFVGWNGTEDVTTCCCSWWGSIVH